MSKKIGKNADLLKKAMAIKLLVLDVDGVMTDGSIGYTAGGDEYKYFDAKDGVGLKYWLRAGLKAGIITGRSSPAVDRRAGELGVSLVIQGARDKAPAFERMVAAAGVAPGETAVMGDDLPDIPLFRRAGLGIAVAYAVAEARESADWVTDRNGGRGAVREVIEAILRAQNRWEAIVAPYRSG